MKRANLKAVRGNILVNLALCSTSPPLMSSRSRMCSTVWRIGIPTFPYLRLLRMFAFLLFLEQEEIAKAAAWTGIFPCVSFKIGVGNSISLIGLGRWFPSAPPLYAYLRSNFRTFPSLRKDASLPCLQSIRTLPGDGRDPEIKM